VQNGRPVPSNEQVPGGPHTALNSNSPWELQTKISSPPQVKAPGGEQARTPALRSRAVINIVVTFMNCIFVEDLRLRFEIEVIDNARVGRMFGNCEVTFLLLIPFLHRFEI